jgi:hypothetical protein
MMQLSRSQRIKLFFVLLAIFFCTIQILNIFRFINDWGDAGYYNYFSEPMRLFFWGSSIIFLVLFLIPWSFTEKTEQTIASGPTRVWLRRLLFVVLGLGILLALLIAIDMRLYETHLGKIAIVGAGSAAILRIALWFLPKRWFDRGQN